MRVGGSKIGRKAEALIAALLTAPTQAAAGAAAGVSEATVQRWLRDEAFLAAYRAARRAVLEAAVSDLQRAAGEAVGVLRRNMACGHPPTEVRAALGVIERAIQGVELFDLAAMHARLDDLEKGTGCGQTAPPGAGT